MEASPADALRENWKPLYKAAGVSASKIRGGFPLPVLSWPRRQGRCA